MNGMGFRIVNWNDLTTPIAALRSVGTRTAAHLRRLGIATLGNLLWHLPWRYDQYEEEESSDIAPGKKVHVSGQVVSIASRRIFPRRMTVTTAMIAGAQTGIRAVWFNQPYLQDVLAEGTRVSVAGAVKRDARGIYLASPTYERLANRPPIHTQGLVPVYPETAGISSKYLRMLIYSLMDGLRIPDPLPRDIIAQAAIMPLSAALRAVHMPQDASQVQDGRKRLAFDELLLFQLKALMERRSNRSQHAIAIPHNLPIVKDFIRRLPFRLTGDQKVAAWEIMQDLEKQYPMNRLLEGDVGSGKTVVALLAALGVAHHGHQTVFLAPTEVLARQHFTTLSNLLAPFHISVGILTASQSAINTTGMSRRNLKQQLKTGALKMLVGTHAVIQKDVFFSSLALLVVDEQHRFGISQRAALTQRHPRIPHLLSMTATPIPRTLALTIYGDLDISLLKQKPAERLEIITKLVTSQERSATYQFVRDEVRRGRQIFVLCPRIEPSETTVTSIRQQARLALQQEVKAVEHEYTHLTQEIFPDLRVAMLHGRMSVKEKTSAMNRFSKGDIDILVATSVIEVGIDIPNASVMLIEGAELFGLAQLHQLRGRVGRAHHQSYCFLMLTTPTDATKERLKVVAETPDGFLLAEKDMALRGPGEFFGVKQAGIPDLAMASLANMPLIQQARQSARTLLHRDPSLARSPLLRERLERVRRLTHFE